MNVLITDPAQVEAIRTGGDRTLIVLDTEKLVLPSPWCDLTDQVCPHSIDTWIGSGGLVADFMQFADGGEPQGPPECDCVAGRPVHRLQATCPTPGFIRRVGPDSYVQGPSLPRTLVDLGCFTVQIVPVEVGPFASWPDHDCVERLSSHARLWTAPACQSIRRYETLTFDPLPQPGQHVAILERQP